MNINLLPRKSRFQKIFWPVMLTVIIIYVSVALFLVYTEFNNGASIEEKKEEIVQLQTEINNLRAIRQPDPLAEDFLDFQSDVTALKEFRRDWIQILNQISTALPTTSRVISFQVNTLGELEMDSQFANLQQVAEYVAKVGQIDSIESVNATKIARVELTGASATPSDNSISGVLEDIPGLGQKLTAPEYISPDDFIANLEENLTPPQDESERILNELRWLMEQKATQQEHGITLPTIEMPDVPNIESWLDSGLFTPEEIGSAWEEVDQFKDQSTTPPSGSVREETIVEKKKIYVYQTTLTIKMAPLDTSKEVSP